MDGRLDWVKKSLSHKETEDMLLKIGHALGLELCHDRHAYKSGCSNLLWYYRLIPSIWQKKLSCWKRPIDLDLARAITIASDPSTILWSILRWKRQYISECYSPYNIQAFTTIDTSPFYGISHREELEIMLDMYTSTEAS